MFYIAFPFMILAMGYMGFHVVPLFRKLPIPRWLAWVLSYVLILLVLALGFFTRSILLGIFLYTVMFWALFDIVRLLFYLFARDKKAHRAFNRFCLHGVTAIAFAIILSIYGVVHAQSLYVTQYEVPVERFTKNGTSLRVAMISDIHLGALVKEDKLLRIIETTNACKPDIILLGGDIFVEDSTQALISFGLEAMQAFQAPLGVYYVPGNHEYYAPSSLFTMEELEPRLNAAGITLLRDKRVVVDDAFYLIGREDYSRRDRASLSALMEGMDPALPVIVLDHQPRDLALGATLGVDLQLSGHTHAGQIFPLGQISMLLGANEKNYGLLSDGDYHAIVTSGAGAWGTPMRVGTSCEIAIVDIH